MLGLSSTDRRDCDRHRWQSSPCFTRVYGHHLFDSIAPKRDTTYGDFVDIEADEVNADILNAMDLLHQRALTDERSP